MVGTSEYHAVWDLVQCTEEVSDGDFTAVTVEQAEFMVTQLEELEQVARQKREAIQELFRELLPKYGAATAQ